MNCYNPNEIVAPAISVSNEAKASIATWKQHIDYLCQHDPDASEWLWYYIVHAIKYPLKKIRFIPLIATGQGVGKSIIGDRLFSPLYGRYMQLIEIDQIVESRFSSYLMTPGMLILEELPIGVDRRKLPEIFKKYATSKTLLVEMKYKDAFPIRNQHNFLIMTNHDDAVKLDIDDRRFLCIKGPKSEDKQSKDYFQALKKTTSGKSKEKLSELVTAFQEIKIPKYIQDGIDNGDHLPKTEFKIDLMSRAPKVQVHVELVNRSIEGFVPGFMHDVVFDVALNALFLDPNEYPARWWQIDYDPRWIADDWIYDSAMRALGFRQWKDENGHRKFYRLQKTKQIKQTALWIRRDMSDSELDQLCNIIYKDMMEVVI